MSSYYILGLFILCKHYVGALSINDDVVLYRNHPLNLHEPLIPRSNYYRISMRRSMEEEFWNRDRQRPQIYSRNTQTRPYGYQIKVREAAKKNDPLMTITETLGALNTVGNYIVNMTRGVDNSERPLKELPSALYTISKNILGQNVTDSIAPIVRDVALPLRPVMSLADTYEQQSEISDVEKVSSSASSKCTTAEGGPGKCQDLSSCPQLLLDLTKLRQSLCFKSLFVPGVCCPQDKVSTNVQESGSSHVAVTLSSPVEPGIRPTKSPIKPTPKPIPLYPVVTVSTTKRPVATLHPLPDAVNETIEAFDNNFIQDDDECGVRNAGKYRVVGGDEALPGRWPWMAAIFLHGSRRTEFWCGGSLIGSKYVLTAAHCTRDQRQRPFAARQFTVRLGDIDLERDDEPSSPATYTVKNIRAHPKFSRVGFYNDIAILELSRPVRKTSYITPICIPPVKRQNEQFAGARPTVVGWGTTYYGGKESKVQRQAILPVWRNEDCNAAYFQPITSTFLCAGYIQGGKDACQGDSGGPLMLKAEGRWMQIGIVSFGNKCGEPGYPGVYTRVTEYIDWIHKNLN